jgi:hypothetical protein
MHERKVLTDGSRYIEWADIMRIHEEPSAVEETKPDDRADIDCQPCEAVMSDCLSSTKPIE